MEEKRNDLQFDCFLKKTSYKETNNYPILYPIYGRYNETISFRLFKKKHFVFV